MADTSNNVTKLINHRAEKSTGGRPPIFGAMTDAERQARCRARKRRRDSRRRQLDGIPQQADIDLSELPPFDIDDAGRFLAERNVLTVLAQLED